MKIYQQKSKSDTSNQSSMLRAIIFLAFISGFGVVSFHLALSRIIKDESRLSKYAFDEQCATGQKGISCQHYNRTDYKSASDDTPSGEFVILVIPDKGARLFTFLQDLLKISEDIPIIVSNANLSPSIKDQLSTLPVLVVNTFQSNSHQIPFASFGQQLFASVLTPFHRTKFDQRYGPCPAKDSDLAINILNASYESQAFQIYSYTPNDEAAQLKAPFGDSKYNFHTQKILNAQHNGSSRNGAEYAGKCQNANLIKRSFMYMRHKYSNFKYAIVLNSLMYFSSSLIRYFKTVSKLIYVDPSIYCVSAHNPLIMNISSPPEEDLILIDTFVYGGATLLTRVAVNEIIDSYQVPLMSKEEQLTNSAYDPMIDVEEWLSWWRRRKLRTCVVPAAPRICQEPQQCFKNLTTSFNLESMKAFKYFIKLFNDLGKTKPLNLEDLPCRNNKKPQLDNTKNESSYSLYVKMMSTEDDLTLKYMLECFGIYSKPQSTNFENVYKLYWGRDAVYILGVPYSRFGPTIKKEANLYIVESGPQLEVSIAGVTRAKNIDIKSLNITTVPFGFNDEE